jgi:hypothetical protein
MLVILFLKPIIFPEWLLMLNITAYTLLKVKKLEVPLNTKKKNCRQSTKLRRHVHPL